MELQSPSACNYMAARQPQNWRRLMQFGLSIPHRGPLANPEAIRAIAENAEASGYGVLSMADHIVVPRTIDSRYPYSPDGGWAGGADGACFEQISLLNYVAGITRKARLLTSIMVIPHREPIFTAKALATADQLSGGRVELGIGTGWMREEFELLKTPPFKERGAVTDEYIRAFKTLWTEENPAFEGNYVQFKDIFFQPKPIHAYDAALAKLREAAEKANRDPATITLAYNAMGHSDRDRASASGERMLMTGSAAARQDDAAALAERGVATMVVNVAAGALDKALAKQNAFAEDVMSAF